MNALLVYESIYGNTRAIAEAIAEGLGGEVTVLPVHVAAQQPGPVDLLVVGGPTHMHGLATDRSRLVAADGAREDGAHVEPGATGQPGLRSWLRDLPDSPGLHAATFDTRLDRSPWMTGTAARGIARRLRRHGIEVLASESFLVQAAEGPLEPGELDRGRSWGETLAQRAAVGSRGAVNA